MSKQREDEMKKPDQPPVVTRATAVRDYKFPSTDRRMVEDWKGNPLVCLRLRIERACGGGTSIDVTEAVGFKKDGTVSAQQRSARRYWNRADLPDWIRELADDMPTPKVTLVPPSKDQP